MIGIMPQTRRERALLLATGQLTSYGSGTGMDDGALRLGKAKRYVSLTTGQYAGTTNIVLNGKTDMHQNACVEDCETGKIWSMYVSASVGPASDGKLPWTNTGSGATLEGIFPYCVAANAALLAGYGDWRIPNRFEIEALIDCEAPTAMPNNINFPSWTTLNVYSSTTRPDSTTGANYTNFTSGYVEQATKTIAYYVALVRGGR